jgi:predicted transport protein
VTDEEAKKYFEEHPEEFAPEMTFSASHILVETEEKATGLNSLVQREKIPFNKKLLSLDSEIKNYFSEVHNEIISHKKVNYRISVKGISYKTGRKALAKMVVRGKTLKLHLALNVNDYPKTVYFQEDSSNVVAYKDVPFTVKVKSNRAKNNAVKLVNSLAEKNNLVKKEEFKGENVLNELKTFK